MTEREMVIIKNGKTWTFKKAVVVVAFIVSTLAVLGNFIQPFVWGARIESKVEALAKTDEEAKQDRKSMKEINKDQETRLRMLEEDRVPLGQLKVQVDQLIKSLDRLQNKVDRFK